LLTFAGSAANASGFLLTFHWRLPGSKFLNKVWQVQWCSGIIARSTQRANARREDNWRWRWYQVYHCGWRVAITILLPNLPISQRCYSRLGCDSYFSRLLRYGFCYVVL